MYAQAVYCRVWTQPQEFVKIFTVFLYVVFEFLSERYLLMMTPYFETIQIIERLHRYFLDVVKVEIDRKGIQDVNNVQCMILYNIGHDELTVGELTLRGYYLGSNVSYNVKKMTENGYIEQSRSVHDKRSIRVKLTEKGKELYGVLDGMFKRHEEKLADTDIEDEDLKGLIKTMNALERFWTAQSQFTGLASLDDE